MAVIPLIIPAYEPDERMLDLIKEIRETYNGEIIIMNDGSGLEYEILFEEARKLNCVILKHYRNMGKGRALKDAFNYCLNTYQDIVGCVTADSDGQHCPKDIYKCMDGLSRNEKTLILGCRDFEADGVPYKSKFGNKLTRKVCKYISGLDISDTQTGLRGIPKEFMADLLNTPGERFEFETRMLLETKDKYGISEVTIETIYDSKENHQTHFHPIKDSLRVYKIFGEAIVKFMFASLSSSVIDLALFYLFCVIFKSRIVAYLALSTVMARVISAIYNYVMNYKVVFVSKKQHKKSVAGYVVLAVIQMLCSALFVTIGCTCFGFLPELIVKIIVDTILFFISYSIQRTYVF